MYAEPYEFPNKRSNTFFNCANIRGQIYFDDDLWFPSQRDSNEDRVSILWRHHVSLQWRHNELDGISNHQPYDYLMNCLFKRRSKKTSKFRVTGLCVGNSPLTGEFPAQRASNAENGSIWWRHHVLCFLTFNSTLPPILCNSPSRALISDDLPLPTAPTTATREPRFTRKSILEKSELLYFRLHGIMQTACRLHMLKHEQRCQYHTV